MFHDVPNPLIKTNRFNRGYGGHPFPSFPLLMAFFSGYFSTNCVKQVPLTPLKVFNLRSSWQGSGWKLKKPSGSQDVAMENHGKNPIQPGISMGSSSTNGVFCFINHDKWYKTMINQGFHGIIYKWWMFHLPRLFLLGWYLNKKGNTKISGELVSPVSPHGHSPGSQWCGCTSCLGRGWSDWCKWWIQGRIPTNPPTTWCCPRPSAPWAHPTSRRRRSSTGQHLRLQLLLALGGEGSHVPVDRLKGEAIV